MFESYTAIIVSASLWTIHYFIVRLLMKNKSAEFCNRIITLAHGSSVAIMGLNQCFIGEVSPIHHPDLPTTNPQKLIMVWSLGYFLFDLGWCIAYRSETALMICHHLCAIASLYTMLNKDTSGGQTTCSLGALEVTNPFLQARWFVRTYGYHKTPLFHSVEIVYVLTFLFIRIVMGSFYLFVVLTHNNSWDYILMAAALYTISWLFVLKILQYMKGKYGHIISHFIQIHSHPHHDEADVIPMHS